MANKLFVCGKKPISLEQETFPSRKVVSANPILLSLRITWMYNLDWTTGCPDICLNEILDAPADMFQMKLIFFPIAVIAERMAIPSVDRALSTQLKIWVNSKPYLPES